MVIEDIKNFLTVGNLLATGGQPTAPGVSDVAAAGFQAVVNLGLLDPKYCLPDEAGLVASAGMEYHYIPVKFGEPHISDFERFVDVVDTCGSRRTFVHCALNWRVSAFVSLYGQLRLGWSPERANSLFAPSGNLTTHGSDSCRIVGRKWPWTANR